MSFERPLQTSDREAQRKESCCGEGKADFFKRGDAQRLPFHGSLWFADLKRQHSCILEILENVKEKIALIIKLRGDHSYHFRHFSLPSLCMSHKLSRSLKIFRSLIFNDCTVSCFIDNVTICLTCF